jgi:serine/threonine-protein kinase
MGEVYEAEDTVKDRIVALKLLPESASHDPVFRKRLQREAHSAGRLQEPHVVPIHDYGEVDGLLYVDMRMIDGNDLRKVLKSFGPMTPAKAVKIVRQIASALDAAHESGVMHRDVKPETS